MLTDRRWADRGIAWIAFESGFGDLSYFNRTFKRCYGARPHHTRCRLEFVHLRRDRPNPASRITRFMSTAPISP